MFTIHNCNLNKLLIQKKVILLYYIINYKSNSNKFIFYNIEIIYNVLILFIILFK